MMTIVKLVEDDVEKFPSIIRHFCGSLEFWQNVKNPNLVFMQAGFIMDMLDLSPEEMVTYCSLFKVTNPSVFSNMLHIPPDIYLFDFNQIFAFTWQADPVLAQIFLKYGVKNCLEVLANIPMPMTSQLLMEENQDDLYYLFSIQDDIAEINMPLYIEQLENDPNI